MEPTDVRGSPVAAAPRGRGDRRAGHHLGCVPWFEQFPRFGSPLYVDDAGPHVAPQIRPRSSCSTCALLATTPSLVNSATPRPPTPTSSPSSDHRCRGRCPLRQGTVTFLQNRSGRGPRDLLLSRSTRSSRRKPTSADRRPCAPSGASALTRAAPSIRSPPCEGAPMHRELRPHPRGAPAAEPIWVMPAEGYASSPTTVSSNPSRRPAMTDWNGRGQPSPRCARPVLVTASPLRVMNNCQRAARGSAHRRSLAHARRRSRRCRDRGCRGPNIGTLSPAWVEAMRLAAPPPTGEASRDPRPGRCRRHDLPHLDRCSLARSSRSPDPRQRLGVPERVRLAAATMGVERRPRVARRPSRRGARDAARHQVAITGEVDLVTDGETALEVRAGHADGTVTGTGCAATCSWPPSAARRQSGRAAAGASLLRDRRASEFRARPCPAVPVALYDSLASIQPATCPRLADREVSP